MNKTSKFVSLLILSAVAVCCGVFSSHKLQGNVVSAEKQSLKMTFDGSHHSFTTANGNKFSSSWLKKLDGCSQPSNAFAFLQGTATYDDYNDGYIESAPIIRIYGSYKISNITSIVIKYNITTSFSYLSMSTLDKSYNKTSSGWSIGSTWTSGSSETKSKTISFSTSNSYYGFAFTLTHDGSSGGSRDTMKSNIFSVTINYSC